MEPLCDYLHAADEVVFGQVTAVRLLTRNMATTHSDGSLGPVARADCDSAINWGVEISLQLIRQRRGTIREPAIDIFVGNFQAGTWDPLPSVVALNGDDQLEWVHITEEGAPIEIGQGLGLSLIRVGDYFVPVGEPLFAITNGALVTQGSVCTDPATPGGDLDGLFELECGEPSESAVNRLQQKKSMLDYPLWSASHCL